MGMETTLVPYLLDEHPQTAAYILSRLTPDLAARCIELLPAALRASVTARLLRIEDVKKPVLDVLEKVIQEDLFGERAAASGGSDDRLERLANIINRLDRTQADEIINDIIKINPEDGAALRKLIFMFEDIALLEQQHRAKLLDRVSTDLIIASLLGPMPRCASPSSARSPPVPAEWSNPNCPRAKASPARIRPSAAAASPRPPSRPRRMATSRCLTRVVRLRPRPRRERRTGQRK